MGESILDKFGFKKTVWVEGRRSIANLFGKKRTGIYSLKFSDGDYYIGLSIDVVKRFSQHAKEKNDILHLRFLPSRKEKLDSLESQIIAEMEKQVSLRNIAKISIPPVESDLDLVVDTEMQAKWLGGDYVTNCFSRLREPNLRKKNHQRFLNLWHRTNYKNQALPVMQEYFSKCVLEPYLTEMSFWGVSALPGGGKRLLSRININWQEVCSIIQEDEVVFTFHLADSPLGKSLLKDIEQEYKGYFEQWGHTYSPGGADQTSFCVHHEVAIEIINIPQITESIKLLNHRLMKKGGCRWGENHCLDLADHLLPGA